MTVKVKEGRFYRDGNGEKRGPMEPSGDPVFPWRCPTSRFTYTNDGMHFSDDVGSLYDLIAETDEAPTTEAATWLPWRSYRAAPKLWRDMTPEEKGALLLAKHEGRVIEGCKPGSPFGSGWAVCDPLWTPDWAYRLRSEPRRVTVKARVCITEDGMSFHMTPESGADAYSSNHYYATLTFTVIDGKPDWANAKLEALE